MCLPSHSFTERERERKGCICSSLKGANERTCVPPGLVEWGVDEGLAFPSSPIVKKLSQDKQGSSIPRRSSDNSLAVPPLMMKVMLGGGPAGQNCDSTWKKKKKKRCVSTGITLAVCCHASTGI